MSFFDPSAWGGGHLLSRLTRRNNRTVDATSQTAQALAQFLATVNREISTPMNAIIGLTDSTLAGSLAQEQRDNLEMVRESAESLLDLLKGILDFSGIGSGKIELQQSEFCLSELLDNAVGSLMALAERKKAGLYCRIDPSLPTMVIADRNRLKEVLINLLGNALKCTEKGEVLLHVEKAGMMAVSQHCDNDTGMESIMIHASITDTGIGLPRKEPTTLFDAFAQADGSAPKRFHGIGMGLAISTQLVELMGGNIWQENEKGMGSTIHFTAKVGCYSGETVARPIRRIFNPTPVLLVGGSNTGRLILKEILEARGFSTGEAEDDRAAMAMMYAGHAMGKPFRLLVVDSSITETDIMEFIRRVKLSPTLALSEIIYLFSPKDERDGSFSELSQTCKLVRKPVVESRLLGAVSSALEQTEPTPVDIQYPGSR